MNVLQTDRLVLRRQTEDDAPFILALMTDPDWLRHIGDRGVRTVEEARAYIGGGAVSSYERHGFGLWLVETRAEHVPVGICGLVQRDGFEAPDLGFALAREYRGRGYAREAATATLAYARATIGFDRVDAIVSPTNAASVRLLEALRFTFETEVELPGGTVHLYAMAFGLAPP